MNKVLRIILFSILGAILLPIIVFLENLGWGSNFYFIITEIPIAILLGIFFGCLIAVKHYEGVIGSISLVVLGWLVIDPISRGILSKGILLFVGLVGEFTLWAIFIFLSSSTFFRSWLSNRYTY